MLYLKSFHLPDGDEEDGYLLSYPYQQEMQCYSHENVYPFRVFPEKGLREVSFEPITVLYGGNGSGKSTLLHLVAEKLSIPTLSPFGVTPYFPSYLDFCHYTLAPNYRKIPEGSEKIVSDDVFDFLLDTRSINEGIDRKRNELFEEYASLREIPMRPLSSLEEFEAFKRQGEAKRRTKSDFTARRLPKEMSGNSNGESAFVFFTRHVKENALYLLDEPENSLSASMQMELARFLEDSARFYGCQLVISTHSPFLLSMRGAKIYDLDARPVAPRRWTELGQVRAYFDFFKSHEKEFD